jgi:hypothetical protein
MDPVITWPDKGSDSDKVASTDAVRSLRSCWFKEQYIPVCLLSIL